MKPQATSCEGETKAEQSAAYNMAQQSSLQEINFVMRQRNDSKLDNELVLDISRMCGILLTEISTVLASIAESNPPTVCPQRSDIS